MERSNRMQNRASEGREIDLVELLVNLLSQWYIIAAATVLVGIVAAVYFYLPSTSPNEYSASTTLYVRNQLSGDNVISTSDLSSSLMLVNDYSELISSRRVTDRVCKMLGLPSLSGYTVKVSSVTNTRFLRVTVTGLYPESVAYIANAISTVFADVVKEVMEVSNVSVVDEAVVPTRPSGPPRMRNTVIAMAVAFAATVGVLVIVYLGNNTLKTAEDIEEQCGIPVLATVSVMKTKK